MEPGREACDGWRQRHGVATQGKRLPVDALSEQCPVLQIEQVARFTVLASGEHYLPAGGKHACLLSRTRQGTDVDATAGRVVVADEHEESIAVGQKLRRSIASLAGFAVAGSERS